MQMIAFVRANHLPFSWRATTDPAGRRGAAAVRLPGGVELQRADERPVLRALGVGRELAPREEVDLLVVGAGPAGLLRPSTAPRRASTRSSSRAPRSAGRPARRAGSRTTSASRPESPAPSSRAAPSPRRGSSAPARRRRTARSRSSRATAATSSSLEDDHEIAARAVVLATGAEYRRLPVDDLADYEGLSVFYAAGPPEAQLCGASRVGVVGGGNSAGQAAVWLARGGALVTLLHRRGDLRETMSDYLIHELDRFGVVVRDRSEIAELHGDDGRLDAVTLKDGERLPFSFLFFFLGARPCTEWLDDAVARDDGRFHPHRRRSRRGASARDERSRHLRRRRCSLRLDEAVRGGGRRRLDGGPARPPTSRGRDAERDERDLHASRSSHAGRLARVGRRL